MIEAGPASPHVPLARSKPRGDVVLVFVNVLTTSIGEIIGVAVARAKAAGVNAKYTRKHVIGLFWTGDIELQMLVLGIGILNSTFEQDALRNIELGPYSSNLCDCRAKERTEKLLKGWHKASIRTARASSSSDKIPMCRWSAPVLGRSSFR